MAQKWARPRALSRMATPQHGDRILVFRLHWLNLILAGEKDLEIRGRDLSGGRHWLGCRGTIFGHAILEPAIPITSAQAWRRFRHRHRVGVDKLPDKKTYGLAIRHCRRVRKTPYEHPQGAVGIVKYR